MRQIVEARDMVMYFGKSKHTCYKILKKIRLDLGKSSSQPITIQEFDDYYKFEKNGIATAIMENDALKKTEKRPENPSRVAQKEEIAVENTSHKPYQFSKNHKQSNYE